MFKCLITACVAFFMTTPAVAQNVSCTTLPGLASDYEFQGQPSTVGGSLHTVYRITIRPGASSAARVDSTTLYGNQCFRFTSEYWDMVGNRPVSHSSGSTTSSVVTKRPVEAAQLRSIADSLER